MARPSPVSDQVKRLFAAGRAQGASSNLTHFAPPGAEGAPQAERRHLWSIDELHQAVVQALGAADYSTVFRAVSGMEKDRLISRIDLGDGKVHYELSDEHHEHIRCDSCGRVVEVPGCVLEGASSAVKTSTGFTVTSHQLLFTGTCPECAA